MKDKKMWADMEFNEFAEDVARAALTQLLEKGGSGFTNLIRSALLDASRTPLDSRPKE